jgi:stage III sporulation protein AG
LKKKTEKLFGLSKKKLPWLLVLFLIGVVLLTVSSFVPEADSGSVSGESSSNQQTSSSVTENGQDTSGMAEAEAVIETRLETILAKIDGVGEVSVTVILENGPQYIYAINEDINETKTEEKDSNGGSRVTIETTNSDQMVMAQPKDMGGQQPVVVKEIKPEIAGVLVAAEGARDAQIKETLTRAVETLLDVSAHKVSVLPKEVE